MILRSPVDFPSKPPQFKDREVYDILIPLFVFFQIYLTSAFSASIYDQPKALSAKTTRAIQTLLLEHERLTGDEVSLAIISQRMIEDRPTPMSLKEWAHQTYLGWRMGTKNAGRGVLLVLSPESKEAEIEVGYGLESVVTSEIFTALATESIVPALAERKLNIAAIHGVYGILESLSSPLVQSGEASELLKKDGIDDSIFENVLAAPPGWVVGSIVGLGCLLILFMVFRSQKKNFHRLGWFKGGWLGKPTTAAEFLDQLDALPGDRLGDSTMNQEIKEDTVESREGAVSENSLAGKSVESGEDGNDSSGKK